MIKSFVAGLLGISLLLACNDARQANRAGESGPDSPVASVPDKPVESAPASPDSSPVAVEPTVDTDWLIVPGKSAGQTFIGEDAEQAYRRFGRPDAGDAAMQKSIAIWYADHDKSGHSTAIFTSRDAGNDPVARITQIRVTSPSFRTAEGIHTGSLLQEIRAAYPVKKSEDYQDRGQHYRVFDSHQGIAFEVDAKGICTAIIVHAPGKDGGTSYLKFRNVG